MPGFYINHLKSPRTKALAIEIEKEIAASAAGGTADSTFVFPGNNERDTDEIYAAGYAVLRDHPELFYYSWNLQPAFDGSYVSLHIPLLYSREKILSLKAQIEQKIQVILRQVPIGTDLWEKERFLFEYIQTNVRYVHDNAPERYSLVGSLVLGQAVCEGISKAFAVLCHRVGIPCIVVCSETHMWNLVNIEGKLVNVDATHGTGDTRGACDYTFFNVNDAEMINAGNRKELDCVPACTDASKTYYARKNLVFRNEQDLKAYILRALYAREMPIHAKLSQGNIAAAIESATRFSPCRLTYSYSESAKTVLIT